MWFLTSCPGTSSVGDNNNELVVTGTKSASSSSTRSIRVPSTNPMPPLLLPLSASPPPPPPPSCVEGGVCFGCPFTTRSKLSLRNTWFLVVCWTPGTVLDDGWGTTQSSGLVTSGGWFTSRIRWLLLLFEWVNKSFSTPSLPECIGCVVGPVRGSLLLTPSNRLSLDNGRMGDGGRQDHQLDFQNNKTQL